MLPKGHMIAAKYGEVIACKYLRDRGYTIINRNVEIGKNELDIVARLGDMVVFVEVKSKNRWDGYAPSDRVNAQKLGGIRHAAQIWIDRRSESQRRDIPARIDVIGVVGKEVVEHYEDVTA